MTATSEHAVALRALEERLLSVEGRASQSTLDVLLADEFIEFGSSGSAFGKQETIAGLAEESSDGHHYRRTTRNWSVRDLAEGVVLVTYGVTRDDLTDGSSVTTLRSSIWKRFDNDWRLVFHQGTRVPTDKA